MSDVDAGTPGAGQFPGKTLLEPHLIPVFQEFGGRTRLLLMRESFSEYKQ